MAGVFFCLKTFLRSSTINTRVTTRKNQSKMLPIILKTSKTDWGTWRTNLWKIEKITWIPAQYDGHGKRRSLFYILSLLLHTSKKEDSKIWHYSILSRVSNNNNINICWLYGESETPSLLHFLIMYWICKQFVKHGIGKRNPGNWKGKGIRNRWKRLSRNCSE